MFEQKLFSTMPPSSPPTPQSNLKESHPKDIFPSVLLLLNVLCSRQAYYKTNNFFVFLLLWNISNYWLLGFMLFSVYTAIKNFIPNRKWHIVTWLVLVTWLILLFLFFVEKNISTLLGTCMLVACDHVLNFFYCLTVCCCGMMMIILCLLYMPQWKENFTCQILQKSANIVLSAEASSVRLFFLSFCSPFFLLACCTDVVWTQTYYIACLLCNLYLTLFSPPLSLASCLSRHSNQSRYKKKNRC